MAANSETLMRLVRVGLLTLNEDSNIEWADETCSGLLGAHEPLAGTPLSRWLAPAGEEDRRALASVPPFTCLAGVVGSGVPLLVHVARLPGRGLVGTLTVLGEYVAQSQSLAREQLRNTLESIIAGFAHEVRNPMAAILSLTEVAMQQQAGLDSVLTWIPGLVTRVESLLKHALAFSRPLPPRRALHQVDFIVERSISLLRRRDTAVRVEFEADDDLPPVLVDLLQAEQMLVNLFENALDAAHGRVSVSASTQTASVRLAVTDDGPGVPADIASRIFDPFFTTKADGMGLGLAIARDLARLNGGDLRLRSTSGQTTFELFLPSTPAAVPGHW